MITGKTQFIAHLGVPTEVFKAPMIYNPWFEKSGIDTIVVPMGCEAEEYPAFLPLLFKMRNIAGALVTMPHKVTTVSLLDEASAAVKVCEACNAVKRGVEGQLIGDMFDGEGFVRGILTKGHGVEGKSAIVFGNGGVGSSIVASLAAHGASRIALFDPRTETSEALASRVQENFPEITIDVGRSDPGGFDIVVNATPIGMNDDDPMPLEADKITPGAFVGDVVMKAEETPFLAAAKARGCPIQPGVDMLFEMIPAYLEFFGYPTATSDELRAVSKIAY